MKKLLIRLSLGSITLATLIGLQVMIFGSGTPGEFRAILCAGILGMFGLTTALVARSAKD